MSDSITSDASGEGVGAVEPGATSSFSRRNALKAGAAVGVGAVAWSGATITSLGGTPAYAIACTGAVRINLLACRNTDQSSGCATGDFRYHPLKTALPAGYSIVNNVAEGTCCDLNSVVTFNFPAGMTCDVVIAFNAPSQCTGNAVGSLKYGPESDGSLAIVLKCLPTVPNIPSNTQYQINATCFTTGTDPACFN